MDTPLTDDLKNLIEAHAGTANAFQLLVTIQNTYNYVPAEAISHIAKLKAMPAEEIKSILGFYSFLSPEPCGKFRILFSNNITDVMAGKDEVMAFMLRRFDIKSGQTRADNKVSVAETSCIGMSDQGPAALINGHAVTLLDLERAEKIVELVENDTAFENWPKEFFDVKTNIRRKDLLLSSDCESGSALRTLMQQGPEAVLGEIDKAGLRGCGGAGFKTALKWKYCRDAPGEAHYVVCNADEGEPGTFKDRVLLQEYPDLLFEGMTLCARIIGARRGFLYLRGEYRYLLPSLEKVLRRRRQAGLLGNNILYLPDFDFDIDIYLGAGAYVCGEETALLESLEGKRGVPRIRPPFPGTYGYQGRPTVINNVETFCHAAKIAGCGGEPYTATGTAKSKGTKLLSISGDCEAPGIYEFPFGTSVREILLACGAENVQAIQVSGAAGETLSVREFDRVLGFEDVACGGSFMIFNRERDLLDMVRNFAAFFAHESCGFCTPCRVGTSLLRNLLEKISQGHGAPVDLDEIDGLCAVIKSTSHCGLGQTAPNAILDTLRKFSQTAYENRLKQTVSYEPSFDLDKALEDARKITGRNDESAHL